MTNIQPVKRVQSIIQSNMSMLTTSNIVFEDLRVLQKSVKINGFRDFCGKSSEIIKMYQKSSKMSTFEEEKMAVASHSEA